MTGKEKNIPYGNLTIAKMVKNKLDSKNGQDGLIFIRFGFGVDDLYSLIETAAVQKIVKKEGAWYVFGEHRFQGREKFRHFLMTNGKVAEDFKKRIVAAIIASGHDASAEDEDEEKLLEAQIREDLGELGDDDTFDGDVPAEETAVVEDEAT